MPQQIIIAEQLRIAALLTDERVEELIVAQGHYQIGDIFLGTVEKVVPAIDAAFVNIGESEKNGFIHVRDLGPLRLKKNAAEITELLRASQKVLVQVLKEPTGNKGPTLTGNLALPGRYLRLQPHGQGVSISKRINAEDERDRLRALGVLVKPPGTGLVVRSEAAGINEELLIEDLQNLLKQWDSIQQASESCNAPVLLNRDEDFIHRILRDHVDSNLLQVVVDNPDAVEKIHEFLKENNSNVKVESHTDPNKLLEQFRISSAIYNALQPRVDLLSGGYIIIEPTEALTVIDVNSGSFTRSANSRETVLWTNREASQEIAKQLRLRNIGGVIIIDFIDMASRKDQLQLLEDFTASLRKDSSRPQIVQLTELGLVELTRKRQGQNIYELFGKECPHCLGLGKIPQIPGKDQIQTLTPSTGLIQTQTPFQQESTTSSDAGKNKSKRNIKSNIETLTSLSNQNNDELGSEPSQQRSETELIGINMTSEEEIVYGELGLNPLLLLNEIPSNENVIAHVIRPGEDAEGIIEEARNLITSSNNKRRKKGRFANRNTNRIALENQQLVNGEELVKSEEEEEKKAKNTHAELTSLEITDSTVIEEVQKAYADNEKATAEVDEASRSEEEDPTDDPRRRRRRRSSATQ